MGIRENFQQVIAGIPDGVKLIAVTKTHPLEKIMELYNAGYKVFGENKVQELCDKQALLPADVEWHLIGHLQTNKVKYIAPFVHLIHAVDSLKLLREINKQGEKNKRVLNCLLQIYIAEEESKFGLDFSEAQELMRLPELQSMQHIKIAGLMGMATFTENRDQIRAEFKRLKQFFDEQKKIKNSVIDLSILSMGMSGDYHIAIEEGSNMVRIGSALFGSR